MFKNEDSKTRQKVAIICVFIVQLNLMIIEMVTGHITHSTVLIADSIHILNDLISLMIAYGAIVLSTRPKSSSATYGWTRAETVGSLINSVFLLALCLLIIVEAVKRVFLEVRQLEQVDLIVYVGSGGLLTNLFGLIIFGCFCHTHTHGHDHGPSSNMNIRGVFLHVLADALGSIVVIITAILVKFTPNPEAKWKLYIDPTLSLILALIIIISTVPLLKQSSLILLQTVPKSVNLKEIEDEIRKLNGVSGLHDFHVWSLNSELNLATLHLTLSRNESYLIENQSLFEMVKNILHRHGIHTTTLQFEYQDSRDFYDTCETAYCKQRIHPSVE